MKYFFSLLLIGFISFNIPSGYGGPKPSGTGKPDQSQKATATPPDAAAEETETQQRPDTQPREQIPILTERQTDQLRDKTPPSPQDLPTLKSIDPKTMSLRETNIGRAILEGKIEDYTMALKELTEVFDVPLKKDIVLSLMQLMIETTKNREFFTGEMFYLLALHVLVDSSTSRSLSQIQTLLTKARTANNELAVKLLSSLETLTLKYEQNVSSLETAHEITSKDLTRQTTLKEQVIKMAKNHYSKTNIVIKAGFTALAGALTVWGYKLFTTASAETTSISSYVPSHISEFLSKVSDKDISIATMAIGAALAAAGISQCGKAFWRWRKLNNIRNQQ